MHGIASEPATIAPMLTISLIVRVQNDPPTRIAIPMRVWVTSLVETLRAGRPVKATAAADRDPERLDDSIDC
jgi:hypothetical protein